MRFKVTWENVEGGDFFRDVAEGVTRHAAIEASRAWLAKESGLSIADVKRVFVLRRTDRDFFHKGRFLQDERS